MISVPTVQTVATPPPITFVFFSPANTNLPRASYRLLHIIFASLSLSLSPLPPISLALKPELQVSTVYQGVNRCLTSFGTHLKVTGLNERTKVTRGPVWVSWVFLASLWRLQLSQQGSGAGWRQEKKREVIQRIAGMGRQLFSTSAYKGKASLKWDTR